MARTLESTPQLRAVYALSQARRFRHHRDCYCRMFDHRYCNAADAMWSEKLNVALGQFKESIRDSQTSG